MRRAKIVCTLGPATSSYDQILGLVRAGMDMARLNMSHGTHADHQANYDKVRQAAQETGRAVGVLADLQGPKIRLETFAAGPVLLVEGQEWVITTRDVEGDGTICGTTYKGLPGDVAVGDPILIDDGKVRLVVTDVSDTDVTCRVVVPGPVSNHKGINLPGVAVSVPALSEKDIADLRYALELGVDFVALSFVRNAEDAEQVRAIMAEEGRRVPVIAKIEKPQALEVMDSIVDAFDAIMVARGDLGVECPLEDVPFLQKTLIEKARIKAKPVIVATQMLESMISAPAPTRAEASDVANAVLDGADAVMLSGETSVGAYPLQTVRTMGRILTSTEQHFGHRTAQVRWDPQQKPEVISKAAAEVAARMNARCIVAFTQSGGSARGIAAHRDSTPIIAITPLDSTRAQLALTWGVETFTTPPPTHTDQMVRMVDEVLLESGRAERGDHVVIIAGSPPGIPGSTNALRVHIVGDAIDAVSEAYRDE